MRNGPFFAINRGQGCARGVSFLNLVSCNRRRSTNSVTVTLSAAKGLCICFARTTEMLRFAQHDNDPPTYVADFAYLTPGVSPLDSQVAGTRGQSKERGPQSIPPTEPNSERGAMSCKHLGLDEIPQAGKVIVRLLPNPSDLSCRFQLA